MGDDLKPCPWCGAAAELFHGKMRRYARCSNAAADGGPCSIGYRTDDDWNTRPIEGALRARAEAAEAELSALAATVGAAVVASALAPGESLSAPPQHIIVSTVTRLRARAEAAEQRAEALAAELAQARAEGEAAGAARERAAVVAWLRETVWAVDEADYIERGEHVGAAGGAA